jgi:mycothiol system anti-sigma-R factor
MADCSETLKELNRFLDDEVDQVSLAELSAHLSGCVDCQQAFEFHAELKQLVRRAAHEESVPPSLLKRIEECFGEDFGADGNRSN